MSDILKNLKNPPSKYRPLPFWSWNARLKTDETRFQIDEMNDKGMGGFFMHARGGLKTPYMGEEWMDNVKASIDQAKKNDMHAWGYDENGWPSGFASDAVNGLGVEYQQKYLRMEITDEPKITNVTICNTQTPDGKNAHFYYDINPFYVDTLDGKVTDKFIEATHEKYKEALGDDFTQMAGFFTDEPQISRDGLPWSFIHCEEYKKAYGENLLADLYHLFADTDRSYEVRFKFWKLTTRLFCENFMGKVYDWCNKNGSHLTGHMVCEENLFSQLDCNGSVMPNYEYLHIPGIDRLGRAVERSLLMPQVCSVAAQLGKKQILTESFALCGWDVSFEELKWLLEWQMVKGVNLLCHHLAGYSLEGIRKRDYPSGHFYQNPWWKHYNDFNDFASRMGMLLAEGGIKCDTLVLHAISTAWIMRPGDNNPKAISEYNEKMMSILINLDKNQILHHIGDDRIMLRHGKVDGNKLTIGEMSYSTVIVPPTKIMDSSTFALIKEFASNGGRLIFVGEVPTYIDGVQSDEVVKLAETQVEDAAALIKLLPESAKYCSITDTNGQNCDIQYAYRKFDSFEMYYFVNSHAGRYENTKITVKGRSAAIFDYLTGEIVPCHYETNGENVEITHTFEEMGSLVVFAYDTEAFASITADDTKLVCINDKLFGEWKLSEHDQNLLTLDYCDCYFDGELFAKNIFVNDIQEKACALRRMVKIKQDFKVNVKDIPKDKLYLIVESPDNYKLTINGNAVEKVVCGYYRDKSFIKLDITGKLISGENTITLECDFVQPKEVYDQLENCLQFESAKNKLWYDMEIEPIYLLGEFGVQFDKDYEPYNNGSVINYGTPSIVEMPQSFTDGDLTVQSLPFFCGHIKLTKEITLGADELSNRCIEFARRCSAVSSFTVNGKKLDNLYWAPYVTDLSGLLIEGVNLIELDITGNFRNMLGPHHEKCGENYWVCPGNFMHDSPIFGRADWTDGYSFVKYGLFLK